MQLQPIVAHPRRIHLALCHHPFDWLRDGNELAPELADLAQLRITGHVHQHGLIVDDESVCLATGALQPPRNEDPWDPRYNFVCLDVETTDAGPRLAINVHARVWNGRRFVPDPQNHPDGIARARLTIDELTASDPLPDAPADVPPDFVDDSPRLRDHGGNLRYRLSVLPPSDRFTVASELGVASGLEGTVEYLQPRVVVRRCHARDILERLDEALSRYFGPTTRARPNNGGSNG
jgi:hypothetical protein